MNRLTPYAALFMRLAVGGVFLNHGIAKFQNGIGATANFLATHGFPFATICAVILITIETVGAICVLLGILTRAWAAAMASPCASCATVSPSSFPASAAAE